MLVLLILSVVVVCVFANKENNTASLNETTVWISLNQTKIPVQFKEPIAQRSLHQRGWRDGRFRVLGNYCGPGWCTGKWIDERNCDAIHGDSDGSCPDECCKEHDRCCGTSDRRPCNDRIAKCLEQCESDGFEKWLKSWYSYAYTLEDLMRLYFSIYASDKCCGEDC